MENVSTESVFQKSREIIREHRSQIISQVFIAILTRALVFSPLLLAILGVDYGIHKKFHSLFALALCIPLYLLIAFPLRVSLRTMLLAFSSPGPTEREKTSFSYAAFLARGCKHLLYALPWILPLIAYLLAFYYLWNILDATVLLRVIFDAGKLIGGEFIEGLALLTLLFFIVMFLAYVGWRRYLALDYLPINTPRKRSLLAKNIQLMQNAKTCLSRTTFKNFFLTLPTWLLIGLLMGIDLAPRLAGDIKWDTLTILSALTTFDFNSSTFFYLVLVLVFVYLPLLVYRKTALATCLARADHVG